MVPNSPADDTQSISPASDPRVIARQNFQRPSEAAARPERIGPYKILETLGEGGMGVVYLAEQDKPRRVVALKVIKPGYASPQMLKRFEQESQVLGRLQHPGIAQIYEAGVHTFGQSRADTSREREGTSRDRKGAVNVASPLVGDANQYRDSYGAVPYFAMEFIRGRGLKEFMEEEKLGTRERLELVAKICDAVHHAHQKGVIHRDLKPGNILVDESGQPKILDFGVARATDSDIQATTIQTDVGQLIGTIPYMSPEQVAADPQGLDTRSDVYALGVIAYEALAGRLPYDLKHKMIHEAVRVIREEEPAPLSTVNRVFRGDVETIVAKSLEKDKTRRYQSAAELASDIRRYLHDEPIVARPASAAYQFKKFAQRHKAVVVGVAAVFLVLLVGVIVSTSLYLRAEHARAEQSRERTRAEAAALAEAEQRKQAEASAERAHREQIKAERISEFMSQTLEGVGPGVALGRDTTLLREIMDTAAKRINDGELTHAPEAELRLRWTIGNVYDGVVAFDSAEEMFRPAVELARRIHGQEHPDVAKSLHELGWLLVEKNDYAEGVSLCLQSLDMRRKLLGEEHLDVAQSLSTVGVIKYYEGYFPEAEKLLREALRIQRKLLGDEHRDILASLSKLGNVLTSMGSYRDAEEIRRSALAMARKLFGPVHPSIASSLVGVGQTAARKGDYAQAEQLLGEALTMHRTLMGDNHTKVAFDLYNLGDLRSQQGFYGDAERLERESLALLCRLVGPKHDYTSLPLFSLGKVLWHQGKLEEAEQVLREARQIQLSSGGAEKNNELATINQRLAHVLKDTGRHEEAEELVNEALAIKRDTLGDDHLEVAGLLCTLASIRERKGDRSSAEQLVRQAVEMGRRLDEFGMETGAYLQQLGALLYRQEKFPEAEAALRESLQLRRSVLSGDHPAVAECSIALAKLAARQDRFQEGEELARDALRIYEARPDGAAWLHADAQSALGAALAGQGRFTEAETLLVEGLDALRDQSIAPPWIKGDALLALTALYEQWDAAEPGKGYAEKAAEWRAKLEAMQPPKSQNPESPK